MSQGHGTIATSDVDLTWAAATSQGRRRRNEDRHAVVRRPGAVLFLLADGLGGHLGGSEAAEVAIAEVMRTFLSEAPLDLEPAMRRASDVIRWLAKSEPRLGGRLGTTFVALMHRGGEPLRYWHSGDSSLLLLRGGTLENRTEPHTLVNRLRSAGVLSSAEAAASPLRGRLTSYLGMNVPEVSAGVLDGCPGDRLALVSDGVLEAGPERCRTALARDPAAAASELVLGHATDDNATAIVVAIQERGRPCSEH